MKGGDNVRKIMQNKRKALGLTQLELADRVGVTSQFISDIEGSRSDCSLEIAKKISFALGFNIDPSEKVCNSFDGCDRLTIKQAKQLANTMRVFFDLENVFLEE